MSSDEVLARIRAAEIERLRQQLKDA